MIRSEDDIYDCTDVFTVLNAALGLGLNRKYYEPK